MPKNVRDLGKQMLPKALKTCPKSKKSLNLVTLTTRQQQGTKIDISMLLKLPPSHNKIFYFSYSLLPYFHDRHNKGNKDI